MKITWLGHSSFKLESNNNVTIVTDPYDSYVGYSMPKESCDIVTVSHDHNDHNSLKSLQYYNLVIDKQVDNIFNNIKISSILSFHDNLQGKLRGINRIYSYNIDDLSITHLGDIGESRNQNVINSLKGVDILFIPVGGTYTITAKEAFNYCNDINPKIIIPMHYKTSKCNFNIDPIDKFISLFDKNRLYYCQGTLELTKNNISDYLNKIIIFKEI